VSGVIEVPSSAQPEDRAITLPIRVEFSSRWVEYIPRVYVAERPIWLKTGLEWHAFDSGWICFELPEHWRDQMAELVKSGHSNVENLAAQWIIRATTHVLHVHYVCHRTCRQSWPDTIPFWDHGDEGSRQYRGEKAARKNQTRRRAV